MRDTRIANPGSRVALLGVDGHLLDMGHGLDIVPTQDCVAGIRLFRQETI